MKTKKWLIGGAVVVVIALAMVKDATKRVAVRAVEVTEGPIQRYVEERARTSLPRIYHITMPMQGRLLPIELEEGDLIEKGQEVARIEDIDWKDAKVQVDELVIAMENTVKASFAQIKASEARTAYTKWVWEANESTTGQAISERDKQRSQWEFLDSKVKLEGSTATYHAMVAFDAITKMIKPYIDRNFERTTITSPVAGTVLKRHVWNEKMMTPGAPLMDLGDLNQLEITAEILTEEAIRIREGQTVEIFGESFGERFMKGTVRRVEPEAFTKLSSLGVEQQRVNVNIAFDPEQFAAFKTAGFSVGLHYRARVRVITDEKESALLIPRTALFRGDDGGWRVFAVRDGAAVLSDVEIGLSNNRFAEITSGLSVGDQVVDAPESAIEDGLKISIAD